MIGVIAKPGQTEAVEELFELFKTPWEFYQPGKHYATVIATCGDVADVDADLLIVYGAWATDIDAQLGIGLSAPRRGGSLKSQSMSLPVYGEWASLEAGPDARPCLLGDGQVVGLALKTSSGPWVVRLGYDLFDEVYRLISIGQPVAWAGVPTLDIHISMLRNWIVEQGIGLTEILPSPAGHKFVACLTHDIDFVSMRHHKLDHTMMGFLYRSTFGSIRRWLRARISFRRLLRIWRSAFSLPFVYLGWVKDFWEPFDWYLEAEAGLGATYFLIPFKGRAGERVPGAQPSWRATKYDVNDIADCIPKLKESGAELGVHGLDAWHSVACGRSEAARIASAAAQPAAGIRMHWLLSNEGTFRVLDEAGYQYDSTCGYNETIGFRNGTAQVFRPLGCRTLLELPMHIQDGALFFPDRLDLSEPEAWERCGRIIAEVQTTGGVLTLLWHDRSHGPERFWGEFYRRLLELVRAANPWFATAFQATNWFRQRREVKFELESQAPSRPSIRYSGSGVIDPPLEVRVHLPAAYRRQAAPDGEHAPYHDIAWNGEYSEELDRWMRIASSGSHSQNGEEGSQSLLAETHSTGSCL